MARYPNSSEQGDLRQNPPKPMSEIMSDNPVIETVTSMGMDAVDLEKFMHEIVVIYVHPSRERESLDVITPNVGGLNQPIIRGVDTPVKRKYVEALARCHSIRYEQRTPDPRNPDKIDMCEKRVPDYPFDVVQDTPKGKAWLKTVYESV